MQSVQRTVAGSLSSQLLQEIGSTSKRSNAALSINVVTTKFGGKPFTLRKRYN
jgi:hypothetical protein